MSIHILNQPDPHGPVDADRLREEFDAGLQLAMDVPLTRTHLACLCGAAQVAMQRRDCPSPIALVLADFVQFCAAHADFGPETRKLLARHGQAPQPQSPNPQPA